MDNYQQLIAYKSYSRWQEEKQMREPWYVSVDRYQDWMLTRVPTSYADSFVDACHGIQQLQVVPSMRALWSAGSALEVDNIAGYNCSYFEISRIKAWAELMYISMNGCGGGFSVENQAINKLPEIPSTVTGEEPVVVFQDSKFGWAKGYHDFIKHLYAGRKPKWDLSYIRPEGAVLKTFGGRASGPGPLDHLLKFSIKVFEGARGRKLNSLECHDLACMVANIVVAGGVRRSACISLSDLSDAAMSRAKYGEYPEHRGYANNSAVYTERPSTTLLMEEFISLIESRSGERGIFNREAANHQVINTGRREEGQRWGTNPCGEIILRPDEFCNLTEVVIRPTDRKADLIRKVKWAVILGCVQSTLTDFKFISRSFKRNCEEERLLGVSMTGMRDHPILGNVKSLYLPRWLHTLKEVAISTAKEWSEVLGIPVPAAITCVKPSGTVSQLADTSSGLHSRFSPFYIRRIQMANTDALTKLMIDQGVPFSEVNETTKAFEFPRQSPAKSVMVDEVSAIQQLEYWSIVKQQWCEHNPSCTIYVKEKEWTSVLAWVDKNWNILTGITFLPVDNSVYKNPPYEEIDRDTYDKLVKELPNLDFDQLTKYETEDMTEGAKEVACVGGACEI